MLQCLLAVSLVTFMPQWGLISFSLAQLLYTSFITLSYYGYFFYRISQKDWKNDLQLTSVRQLLPSVLKDKSPISSQLRGLIWSFSKQSFLKQLLTEGEKYVMTFFGVLTFADQGVYNVVNNLGSLVVRILFLPMEESFYLFVSQSLQRGLSLKQQPQREVNLVSQVLATVLEVRVLIGFVIATYGFSYSALALQFLYGQQFSHDSGPTLLRWISVYVFLVSVNGITEGFKNATMSQTQVDRYNRVMFGFSLAFLISSLFLTNLFGSIGFVLSNCLNMILRILHSAYYIYQYFRDGNQHPVWSHLPSGGMLAGFLTTFCITATSEVIFSNRYELKFQTLHVAIGAACLVFNLMVFYFTRQPLINFIRNFCLSKAKITDHDKYKES